MVGDIQVAANRAVAGPVVAIPAAVNRVVADRDDSPSLVDGCLVDAFQVAREA